MFNLMTTLKSKLNIPILARAWYGLVARRASHVIITCNGTAYYVSQNKPGRDGNDRTAPSTMGEHAEKEDRSPVHTAVRGLAEELSLDISSEDLHFVAARCVAYRSECERKPRRYLEHYYHVEITEDQLAAVNLENTINLVSARRVGPSMGIAYSCEARAMLGLEEILFPGVLTAVSLDKLSNTAYFAVSAMIGEGYPYKFFNWQFVD